MNDKQERLKKAMLEVLRDPTDSRLGYELVFRVLGDVAQGQSLRRNEIHEAIESAYGQSADEFWKENGQ